jgi:hypothetical protein
MALGAELNRVSYPGLNSSSVDLWRKFLRYYEDAFESYAYNVHVGEGIQAPAYLTDAEKALWKQLTQKRIDVVAERFRETWIIEIVERPGLAAVGQLMGYVHLGQKYLQTRETVRAGLICARLGHDMAEIFRAQAVPVFLFPPAGQPSFPPSFLPTGVTAPPAS